MPFIRAAREHQPLKICLAGTGGAGKTMTALLIARELAGPKGHVGIIDTEQGSSHFYADRIPGGFDVLRLDRAGPSEQISAMEEAAKAGITVLVIDSASAEWNGPGGCLELADKGGAKFSAWKDVTPLHNRWCEAIRAYPGHVITMCRRKVDYAVGPSGAPKKIGLTMTQRDSYEYEMDAVINLEGEQAVVSKSRLESPLAMDASIPRADLPKVVRAATERK